MLNKEKYAKEIVEIAINSGELGVVNNKPVNCDEIECSECDFACKKCNENVLKWANSEYIEQPKLTPEERRFCEYIKNGYVARDKNEGIYWYKEKPMKDASEWDSVGYAIWMKTLPDTPQFEFIKWTDEEPWAVEDLLKLEVEE